MRLIILFTIFCFSASAQTSTQYISNSLCCADIHLDGATEILSNGDTIGYELSAGNSIFEIYLPASEASSIFYTNLTTSPSTSNSADSYIEGKLGVGDFSDCQLVQNFSIIDDFASYIRVSTNSADDVSYQGGIEFYQDCNTQRLGAIEYPTALNCDLHIDNSCPEGDLIMETEGIERIRVESDGDVFIKQRLFIETKDFASLDSTMLMSCNPTTGEIYHTSLEVEEDSIFYATSNLNMGADEVIDMVVVDASTDGTNNVVTLPIATSSMANRELCVFFHSVGADATTYRENDPNATILYEDGTSGNLPISSDKMICVKLIDLKNGTFVWAEL